MFKQLGWMLAVALIAQWPADAYSQPASTNSAPGSIRTIVLKPGESVREGLHRSQQAALLARYGASIGVPWQAPGTPPTSITAPTLTAGTVVSTSLNALSPPAAPVLQFSFAAPSGFRFAIFEFTSPHGQVLRTVFGETQPVTNGTITFQDLSSPLGLYSEAGSWTLTSATIYLEQGVDGPIETTYDQAQLAALFTSTTVNVVNSGTQDYTPPTISAAKILTPIVHAASPPGYFTASLTVQDDISGVNAVFIMVEPAESGGLASYDEPQFPLPVLSGTVRYSFPFNYGAGALEGPYWIVGYGATDIAGNTFLDENPADIKALFGRRTFWVEN